MGKAHDHVMSIRFNKIYIFLLNKSGIDLKSLSPITFPSLLYDSCLGKSVVRDRSEREAETVPSENPEYKFPVFHFFVVPFNWYTGSL